MGEQIYNPIRTVDGSYVPCPFTYRWKQEDISAPDAGRTEDGEMNKMRIGSVVSIELAWRNVTKADAAIILQAFDPEYINVCYLDAKLGNYKTAEFYVGNRATPLYNSALGLWSEISFNIIARRGEDL